MADFKFKGKNPEDENEDNAFRKKFSDKGEEYLPMKFENNKLNEKYKLSRSFNEYLNLDSSFESVKEVLEEISKTNKCTIEQADILNTNFAKLLVGLYHINKKNLHSFYFKKLKNTDYEALNKSILFVVNSNLTFDDICNDIENGKDIKKQILDLSKIAFKDAFSADVEVCLDPRNSEFMHLFVLQAASLYGYIIGRDLKRRIRSNRYFTYESLDEIEIKAISEIYHLLSLTYPYNGTIENFNLNDLFPIQFEFSEYAKEVKRLRNKKWTEKAEWLNSKLEEIESQKRVMTLQEKNIFEHVLSQLVMEMTVPQEGEDIETTRQKAKDLILDSYFKVFLAHYSGDSSGYERNMEVTKKMLLKVIYLIDLEKSKKDKSD